MRVGGRLAAASVPAFDILKGMLPVWLAYKLEVPPLYLGLTAIAACLGHIYPLLFHFRGGKGVATAFGAIAPDRLGSGWSDYWHLATNGITQWLLFIGCRSECADRAVLRLVVQTAVYLSGGDALLPDLGAPSR